MNPACKPQSDARVNALLAVGRRGCCPVPSKPDVGRVGEARPSLGTCLGELTGRWANELGCAHRGRAAPMTMARNYFPQ